MQLQNVSIENTNFLLVCGNFAKRTCSFADCSRGRVENEHRHLLKCVKLYGKFINISETESILSRNIAATMLKVTCKIPNLVKSYDKSNMNVFT